jgi:antitoxin component of RelBE/YafQ-DinJ toxin-antitoxin module
MAERVQFNISIDPEVKEGIYKLAAELNMMPSRLIETVFKVVLSDSARKVEGILDVIFDKLLKEARGKKI